MSLQPEGYGWWYGDDGLWYPPERHPDPNYLASLAQEDPQPVESTLLDSLAEQQEVQPQQSDELHTSPTWHRLISPPRQPSASNYAHLPPPPEPGTQRNPQFGRVAPPSPHELAQAQRVKTSRSVADKVRIAIASCMAVILFGGAVGGIAFVISRDTPPADRSVDHAKASHRAGSTRKSQTGDLSGPGFQGVNSLEEYAEQRQLEAAQLFSRQLPARSNPTPSPAVVSPETSAQRINAANEHLGRLRAAGNDKCAVLAVLAESPWILELPDFEQLGQEEMSITLHAMAETFTVLLAHMSPSEDRDTVAEIRDYLVLMAEPLFQQIYFDMDSVDLNDPEVVAFAERMLNESNKVAALEGEFEMAFDRFSEDFAECE